MSWTKTIKVTYKKIDYSIQVWLSDTNENNKEVVSVQTMANEYYLIEQIEFQSRDAAYDFIKNYPQKMGLAFLIREGYNEGAFN